MAAAVKAAFAFHIFGPIAFVSTVAASAGAVLAPVWVETIRIVPIVAASIGRTHPEVSHRFQYGYATVDGSTPPTVSLDVIRGEAALRRAVQCNGEMLCTELAVLFSQDAQAIRQPRCRSVIVAIEQRSESGLEHVHHFVYDIFVVSPPASSIKLDIIIGFEQLALGLCWIEHKGIALECDNFFILWFGFRHGTGWQSVSSVI
jgi:hypothetical protein